MQENIRIQYVFVVLQPALNVWSDRSANKIDLISVKRKSAPRLLDAKDTAILNPPLISASV